jgi:hypothetical protein
LDDLGATVFEAAIDENDGAESAPGNAQECAWASG